MTQHDIFKSGIAALADNDDGGLTVHGVALGEGDITEGMSGKRTHWPAETLRQAEGLLEGVPLTTQLGEAHVGAEKTDDGVDVNPVVPLEAKVGEITRDAYVEGVGWMWEGEISDPEAAAKVEQGLAEVSPVLARDIEPADEDGLYEATAVKGVRDLGLVSKGAAPSNSIEPGQAAAMTAEALSMAWEGLDMTAEQKRAKYAAKSDDEYNAGKDMAEQMSADQWSEFVDAITREDEHWSGALDAVSTIQGTLRNLMFHLAEHDGDMHGDDAMSAALDSLETKRAESRVENPDDDGQNGDGGQSTGADSLGSYMNPDDITDAEFELLAASRQMDSPAVIEQEDAEKLPEANELLSAASEVSDPLVVDKGDYEALEGRTQTVRQMLEEALVERTELKESTVQALSFDALCGEFEDEDGEFDAEALVQVPESGDVSGSDGDTEALSDDDKARIEQIDTKLSTVGSVLPSERIEALQAEACELAGAEDYNEAIEVL